MLGRSALVRLTNRKVLQVQGADSARFLQAILTNDMKAVSRPQDAIYGAFLTTKGRVLGDCNVVHIRDDTYLLDYDASVDAELVKHWKRYKLRMKAKLEDKTDSLGIYAALPAAISANDFGYIDATNDVEALLKLNEREPSVAHGTVFRDPRGDAFGVRAILPENEPLRTAEDYTESPLHTYTDRRLFLGAAEGHELSDSIPLEADLELLRGISFRKGCYVGQELTARTQFKGNVRKRFVPVALVPAAQQDLVEELRHLPFQRVDAGSHKSLREYLLADSATTVPEVGTAFVKPGSAKSAGSIIAAGTDSSVAIAMMRLEHLFPKDSESGAPTMQFSTGDGTFHAIPYEPVWWPTMDPKTGKMIL